VHDAAYTLADDFKTQKERLIKLEDAFDDLKEHYKDETAILRDETANITFLNTLKTAVQGGTANVATDIDYTLFQDFQVGGSQVYQKKINDWLYFLIEAKK